MPIRFEYYVLGNIKKGSIKEGVREIRKWFMTFSREPSSVEEEGPESSKETGYYGNEDNEDNKWRQF